METCQFCGMYMKPFITVDKEKKTGKATCEMCGQVIAKIEKIDSKYQWKKLPISSQRAEKEGV